MLLAAQSRPRATSFPSIRLPQCSVQLKMNANRRRLKRLVSEQRLSKGKFKHDVHEVIFKGKDFECVKNACGAATSVGSFVQLFVPTSAVRQKK